MHLETASTFLSGFPMMFICCEFDRFENLEIPRAPAQIPTECFLDFGPRRVWFFSEQRFRNEQDAGSAVAALDRAEIRERRLQRVQPAGIG